MLQSYCTDDGRHETQLAYDFFMPLGSPVVAARAGVVREVVENVADDAHTSRLNYLLIAHEDGTVAFYAHLQQDGALVAVADEVVAGEPIALSGASRRTHGSGVLHFGVYRSYPPREERDLPVSFSNAEGPLDARGGLRSGAFYRALP
ncbi:MAG: M23 family metallopeptidase [Actinomycetota bacterium]